MEQLRLASQPGPAVMTVRTLIAGVLAWALLLGLMPNECSDEACQHRLALLQGGFAQKGRVFSVVAFVLEPQAGETVVLNLPKGLEFEEGQFAQQPVARQPNLGYGQVTWRVRVRENAIYWIEADLKGPGRPVYTLEHEVIAATWHLGEYLFETNPPPVRRVQRSP